MLLVGGIDSTGRVFNYFESTSHDGNNKIYETFVIVTKQTATGRQKTGA